MFYVKTLSFLGSFFVRHTTVYIKHNVLQQKSYFYPTLDLKAYSKGEFTTSKNNNTAYCNKDTYYRI